MRSPFLFLATNIIIYVTVCAHAQSLPDPMAPAARNAGGGSLSVGTVSVRTSSISALPDAQVARSMEERIVSSIDSLAGLIQQNQSTLRQLGAQSAVFEKERLRILAERKQVLEDYKSGYFCNQCGKARSEFPTPQDFWAHISEGQASGRRAISATDEQTRKKEAEYDARIKQNEADYAKVQDSIQKTEAQSRSAYDQMQQGLNLWRTAQSFEIAAMAVKQQQEQRQFESDISQASSEAGKAERAFNIAANGPHPDKDTINQLLGAKKMWGDMREKSTEASQLSATYYRDDVRQKEEREKAQYSALMGSIAKTSEYLTAMRSTLDFLPTLKASLADVTVSMSPEELGASFAFGVVDQPPFNIKGRYGFTVKNTTTSLESKAFIELFGKVAEVGWQTTLNPDGTQSTGPTFYVGATPKKAGAPKGADTPIKIKATKPPSDASLPQP